MDIRQPRLGIPSRGFLIDYTIPATSLLPCCKKRKTLAIYNSIPIGIHRSSMSKKTAVSDASLFFWMRTTQMEEATWTVCGKIRKILHPQRWHVPQDYLV